MANIKISELPAVAAGAGTQEFETNDSGTSKKITGTQLKTFVKSGLVTADVTDLTATASELNVLDGVTATTAELNYLDITTLGASQASKVLTADASGNVNIDSNTLYVDAVNNRVGFGTTNPAYTAVISAAGASGIELGPAFSGTANLIQSYDRNGAAYVDQVYGAAQHIFRIGSTEKLRLNGSGAIGLNGANYGTAGQVLASGGSAATPSWVAKGLTLLGTLTTTAGATQTLSSLDLTPYKQLIVDVDRVSMSGTTGTFQMGGKIIGTNSATSSHVFVGFVKVNLETGNYVSTIGTNTTTLIDTGTSGGVSIGDSAFTTATTSISFSTSSGTFDAGQIKVYGVN